MVMVDEPGLVPVQISRSPQEVFCPTRVQFAPVIEVMVWDAPIWSKINTRTSLLPGAWGSVTVRVFALFPTFAPVACWTRLALEGPPVAIFVSAKFAGVETPVTVAVTV